MSHTPGPWTVDGRGIGTPWNITGADGNDVALASQRSSRSPDMERTANARLIAAAPDLLLACKEALLGCTDEFLAPILQAAISKAESK